MQTSIIERKCVRKPRSSNSVLTNRIVVYFSRSVKKCVHESADWFDVHDVFRTVGTQICENLNELSHKKRKL